VHESPCRRIELLHERQDDGGEIDAHRERDAELDRRRRGIGEALEGPGALLPVPRPRVLDVVGGLQADRVPELIEIALDSGSDIGLVLQGQDCQGHDSSSCDWAGNEIRMIVDPG